MPELIGAVPAEGLAADGAALRARGGRGAESRATLADYVTLTKPRIMSLLVLTAVCAMVAAAGGAPATVPLAALVDRRRARLWGRERAQPRARPRHRPADGPAHRVAPGGRRADLAARAPWPSAWPCRRWRSRC